MIKVCPTIEQTKAAISILGGTVEAGAFLLSLGLTYYEALKLLDAADDGFPVELDHRPFLPSGPRQGASQAGTIKVRSHKKNLTGNRALW